MADYLNNNLEEGCLYVFKKGVLQEIESDPDDLMKKIKITPDAFGSASELQRKMRKHMSGYRPDMPTICSALIEYAASLDHSGRIVSDYALKIFSVMAQQEVKE